jgi:hypothetical protein
MITNSCLMARMSACQVSSAGCCCPNPKSTTNA